jgi:PPOX class probable F420-dependent enzyme
MSFFTGMPPAALPSDDDRPVERPMTIPSPERQAEFLAAMPDAIVATIQPDGLPQLTPNWYLWIDGRFWIAISGRTVKARNLRRDPRIVLCIDDPASGDYVQVTGTAELIEGEAARDQTIELCRKYMTEAEVGPHWDSLVADSPRVLVIVHPDRFQWHDH